MFRYHIGNNTELGKTAKSYSDRGELVPDDVVRLRLGEIVPADAILLSGDSIEVDQSALTGESLPQDPEYHWFPK